MMSLEQLDRMTGEAAEIAKALGFEPMKVTRADIETFPPFPFHSIGSYRPNGWQLVQTLLCDSSGLGSPEEPALTSEQFKEFMLSHLAEQYGYAVIEVGQFQVIVGVFKQLCG